MENNDLISRSKLHRMLSSWDWQDLYLPVHFSDLISEQKAVDAATVVHGRWIKAVTYDFAGSLEGYKCNICGRFCTDNAEPYCHCGAKMDGKDDAE